MVDWDYESSRTVFGNLRGQWNRCPEDPALRPAYFKTLLPALQAVARECGYALGLHGSSKRDLDLIAAPWIETCSTADKLAEKIQQAACGLYGAWRVETKPHGRLGYVLHIATDVYIDLSIMPTDHAKRRCDYADLPHSGGGTDHGPIEHHLRGYNICKKCYDAIIAAEKAEEGYYHAKR